MNWVDSTFRESCQSPDLSEVSLLSGWSLDTVGRDADQRRIVSRLSSFEGMCVDAGYINGHRRVKKDVQPTPVAGSSDKKVTWKDGDIIVWNTGYLPSDPKNDPGDQHPKRMVEFSG